VTIRGGLGIGRTGSAACVRPPQDVCDEPVADLRELQVSDEGVAVIIVREGLGVEHIGPEFPALLERDIGRFEGDGFHVLFDGADLGFCLTGGWEGDAVGGIVEAASVEKYGVDCAGPGGTDGQGEAGAGFAVVGFEGFVADEESVPDGDALFGKYSGERGNGADMGLALPCSAVSLA
jgi:hypothetical protein